MVGRTRSEGLGALQEALSSPQRSEGHLCVSEHPVHPFTTGIYVAAELVGTLPPGPRRSLCGSWPPLPNIKS